MANVSYDMMQTVQKVDLNLSPFKKSKAQVLSQTVKAKRLSQAKLLFEEIKDGRLPPVLWTDKKLFTVQATHKEDILLNEQIAYKCQKPVSVIVWSVVTPLIFIKEGVQINQYVYPNMLREILVPYSPARQSHIPHC